MQMFPNLKKTEIPNILSISDKEFAACPGN
jgi:hypothetical protein